MNYCIASRRSQSQLPQQWPIFTTPEELTLSNLDKINPRAIFIPYWSWKIPSDIISAYECVGFHCTDLPYGRGGSPIQNLLKRGHKFTKLTAFRMTDEFDAGPIYSKVGISLDGSIDEILNRLDGFIAGTIYRMLVEWPNPVPQQGEPVYFKRIA